MPNHSEVSEFTFHDPSHTFELSKPDLWLIEQLFLRGRTEADIATQIGITQQAVNKRKWMILLRLRRYMTEPSLCPALTVETHHLSNLMP
jgi:hypothetical protein